MFKRIVERFFLTLFDVYDFLVYLPHLLRFYLFCAWWFPSYPLRVLYWKLYFARETRKRLKEIDARHAEYTFPHYYDTKE